MPSLLPPSAPPPLMPCGGQLLPLGAAQSWSPRSAAVLHVTAGCAWVTLGGPYVGRANEPGDIVLQAGDRLSVPARARVVVEAWAATPTAGPLSFDWCEAAERGRLARRRHATQEVSKSARDVLKALRAMALALGRLGLGALGFARLEVAWRAAWLRQVFRGRWLLAGSRAATAAVSASCAHGCISAGDSSASSGGVK